MSSVGSLWSAGVNFPLQASKYPHFSERGIQIVRNAVSDFFGFGSALADEGIKALGKGPFIASVSAMSILVAVSVIKFPLAGAAFAVYGVFWTVMVTIIKVASKIFKPYKVDCSTNHTDHIKKGAANGLERFKKTPYYKEYITKRDGSDQKLLSELEKGVCYGNAMALLRRMPILHSLASKDWPSKISTIDVTEESCNYQLHHHVRCGVHSHVAWKYHWWPKTIGDREFSFVKLAENIYRSEITFDGLIGVSARELEVTSPDELEKQFPIWMAESFIKPEEITIKNLPRPPEEPEKPKGFVGGLKEKFFDLVGWTTPNMPVMSVSLPPNKDRIFAGKISTKGHALVYQCSNGFFRMYDSNNGLYEAENFHTFCKMVFEKTEYLGEEKKSLRFLCFAIDTVTKPILTRLS